MVFLAFSQIFFCQPPGGWAEGAFYNLACFLIGKVKIEVRSSCRQTFHFFAGKTRAARPALNSPLNNPPPPLNNRPF